MAAKGRPHSKYFGKLEQSVMQIIWEKRQASVKDVLSEINKRRRKLAYTTVMTVMDRLKKKGWLTARKEGRAYVYWPVYLRKEAETEAVARLVRELIADHGDLAIAQFMKELEDATPQQMRRLTSMIRGRKRHGDE